MTAIVHNPRLWRRLDGKKVEVRFDAGSFDYVVTYPDDRYGIRELRFTAFQLNDYLSHPDAFIDALKRAAEYKENRKP